MKKHLANAITFSRILCSIWMWLCPVFSMPFYTAYLLGGFTDMIDGTIARKTGAATAFGEKLDSIADLMFTAVAFAKNLPVIDIPRRVWVFILIIAAIRIANLVRGYIRQRRWIMQHTVLNKVTGFLLFLLPLTHAFIDLNYSAWIVCIMALVSAVQERCCKH